MITYNNIIGRFEKFVEDHFLLKTFTHGSPSGVDLEKFEVYPALHVVYTGSTYDNTSKEYSFEVYILDLPPDKAKKIENQTQLVSNAEQVAEDILADMRNGGHIFDFGHLYTVGNASTTPLEETTSNSLAGILLTISIEVGFTLDSCNAPLDGVNPEGSAFPSASPSGLRIKEVDGFPDVVGVTTIIVSDGTLTDDGLGVVTIDTSDKGAGVYLPLIGGTLTGDLIVDTKIGIGTSTPSEKLDVVGDVLVSGDTMSDAYKPNGAGEPIKLKNFGGDEVVTVLDSGNVGIGTNSPTEKLDVSGNIKASGNINLEDNGKTIFGDGNDLEIYHDAGGDSYIKELGTGQFYLQAENFRFKSADGASTLITANVGGAVNLYHNGTKKFETTSTGASVAGELDMNSNKITEVLAGTNNLDAVNYQQLTDAILGVLVYKGVWNASTNSPALVSGVGTLGGYYIVSVAGTTDLDGITDWAVGDWAVFSDLPTDAWQKIDNTSILGGAGTGGKISVWTGSGTSRTLGDSVITESGGNIGIGTVSPSHKLEVFEGYIKVGDASNTGYGIILERNSSTVGTINTANNRINIQASNNRDVELRDTAGTGNLILKNGGNVGIGTASPSSILDIKKNVSGANKILLTNSSTLLTTADTAELHFSPSGISSVGANIVVGKEDTFQYSANRDSFLALHTSLNGTEGEKFRITSAGNVGIGTTAPSEKLVVDGGSIWIKPTVNGAESKLYLSSLSHDGAKGFYISAEDVVGDNMNFVINRHGQSFNFIGSGANHGQTTRFKITGVDSGANERSQMSLYAPDGTEAFRVITDGNSWINPSGGNVGIGTTTPASKLDVSGGDVEVQDIASGIIMKSPDGTRYRVTVANGGTLSVAAV